MPNIVVITPTGDRPLAFSLSMKWMRNQTLKPTKWIIVDDGKTPMESWDKHPYDCYTRREPTKQDPKYTLVINVAHALKHAKVHSEDTIFIFWEDDEYYAPNYIEEMCNKLTNFDILGIGCARYYHLPSGGYVELKNMRHASLAQTAFRRTALAMVNECVLKGMEEDWLDCNIWKCAYNGKYALKPHIFKDTQNLFVGIKGIPGRNGIGIGHKLELYKTFDKDRSVLRTWAETGIDDYLSLLQEIS